MLRRASPTRSAATSAILPVSTHRRALRRVGQSNPISSEKTLPAAAERTDRALLLDYARAGQDRLLRAGQGSGGLGLAAGGKWIRTIGPWLERGRLLLRKAKLPAVAS